MAIDALLDSGGTMGIPAALYLITMRKWDWDRGGTLKFFHTKKRRRKRNERREGNKKKKKEKK